MFVTASPGMGKTRLLNECLDRMTLEGALSAAAHPLESDHDAPWSSLRQLMRSGLSDAPGIMGTEPEALAVLGAVVPDLAARTTSDGAPDAAQVAHALAALLRAVTEETSYGLVIDDAHYADGATLEVIQAALGELRGVPLVLLVTSDPSNEGVPRALLKLRGEIGRGLPGEFVDLTPLSNDELRLLVDELAPWCDEEDRDRLTRRLAVEAGGSPFLAVTLLRALAQASRLRDDLMQWPKPRATMDTPLPIPIPNLALMAIVVRTGNLGESTARVLKASSVLGQAIDAELLSAVLDLPASDVEAELAELERQHFVTFVDERYKFSANVIPHVIQGDSLTAGELRKLRNQFATELATRTDLESRLLRANLLAQTGANDEAVKVAVELATEAIAGEASRMARRAVTLAENALEYASEDDKQMIKELWEKLE